MFSATLIVFRESLEAALFVGIVAAATRGLIGRTRWLSAGVGVGVLGAVILALMAEQMSAWFDGIGQDLVNIAILSLALGMLLWHCIFGGTHHKKMTAQARQLSRTVHSQGKQPWPLLVAVAMAVLREGAETVLFVAGSMNPTTHVAPYSIWLSGLGGLGLGAAVGYIIYAGLARVPAKQLFLVTNLLMALLAGSIASQLARALSQAGLLDVWSSPVWDSSAWLSENSALGILLHALVGYDARPCGIQLAFYMGALALIYTSTRWLKSRSSRASPMPAIDCVSASG
jgi:high-affinity iron transporter